MSPSSLLNVPPDLMRKHAPEGLPSGCMAAASDRSWAFGVCLVLVVVATALIVALR